MIKRILLLTVLIAGLKLVYSQTAIPAKSLAISPYHHYKKLAMLDGRTDPARSWMDTISFPARENATGTLAATKLRTVYLNSDVSSLLNIAQPPANSSAQTKAELDFLLELQEKRTQQEIERCQKLAGIFHSPNNFNPYDKDYDRNFSSLFHVGSPLGNWYTYKTLPVTAQLLSDAYRDATYYFFKLKVQFARARPYMLESKLKNLERPPHASYPSGHSAASYVNAYIMMEIAPELGSDFLQMAAEMAYSREVLGVHYPSDSEVSRIWARNFVNELLKTEKFVQDLEKVKKEISEIQNPVKKSNSTMKANGACESSCSNSCSSSCNTESSCCKNN
ncbi:MAG: phosphatase PAP2 family protein [Chitinophagaceae bacterium]